MFQYRTLQRFDEIVKQNINVSFVIKVNTCVKKFRLVTFMYAVFIFMMYMPAYRANLLRSKAGMIHFGLEAVPDFFRGRVDFVDGDDESGPAQLRRPRKLAARHRASHVVSSRS